MTDVCSPERSGTGVATSPAPALHPSSATPQFPFSPEEWAVLRADDRRAGAAIVLIMGLIFTLGFIGYLIICLVAAS